MELQRQGEGRGDTAPATATDCEGSRLTPASEKLSRKNRLRRVLGDSCCSGQAVLARPDLLRHGDSSEGD